MLSKSLNLQRPFVYLLAASLVATMLALACERCLAAAAWDGPVPAHGSSGNCHSERHGTPHDSATCVCHSLESVRHLDRDMAVASSQSHSGRGLPPAIPTAPAPDAVLVAGGLLPGGLPAIPRLSPIRRFCIQLE